MYTALGYGSEQLDKGAARGRARLHRGSPDTTLTSRRLLVPGSLSTRTHVVRRLSSSGAGRRRAATAALLDAVRVGFGRTGGAERDAGRQRPSGARAGRRWRRAGRVAEPWCVRRMHERYA